VMLRDMQQKTEMNNIADGELCGIAAAITCSYIKNDV